MKKYKYGKKITIDGKKYYIQADTPEERGGWASDRIMKSVYTETFDDERKKTDAKINDYFRKITG